MTFSTHLKEEITKNELDPIKSLAQLSAYIRFGAQIKKDSITLTMENASVARCIYKNIKRNFGINIKIIIRNQKRFRIKQIYILEIRDKINKILEALNILKNDKITLPDDYFLSTEEEKAAYLCGAFLACGSVNDPSTAGYHMEFSTDLKKESLFLSNIIKEFGLKSKVIKRNNKYMAYLKSAEMISYLIRIFGATNSFFYFEDIRIYRDYKNMVNRLNNCEVANQERVLKTGLKQLEDINYLKEHDLLALLDENIQEALHYRELYPESSLQELANIISQETGRQIGKSGINHYFIKIKKLVEKHKEKNQ